MTTVALCLYVLASFAAGITNTLAGGGSFLTFPSLLLTGLDARSANITSTIALFPMQVSTGFAGRKLASGSNQLSLKALFFISVLGGICGAVLLLATSPAFFARLVPWLIMFATGVFAYSSFRRIQEPRLETDISVSPSRRTAAVAAQFIISVYGGYFGGGIGFLMLAALTFSGMTIRSAGATKNILAAAMNAAAVLFFVFSADVGWVQAGVGILASLAGGFVGVRLLTRVNERALRLTIIVIGCALTVAVFRYLPR